MAHPAVLDSVQHEFAVNRADITDLLEEGTDGRVRGVVVVNDPTFETTPSAIRIRRFWDYLRVHYGALATQVGVILLKTPTEAANEGWQ